MIRVIKRYGSRKLYDTEESRYVSLEEIGDWVRVGQEMQVVDNQSGENVTAQTLMQVMLEEGKRGTSHLSSDLLHGLLRRGSDVVSSGVQSLQGGVDRIMQASVDRFTPLRQVREEAEELRVRLDALETLVRGLDEGPEPQPAVKRRQSGRPKRKGAK